MTVKKIKQKNIEWFNRHPFFNKEADTGFTLIEVMVSVSIFAIVVLISMTAIFSIVDANKKAQALDDVINNMNFSVESMVRDLRTGYNYTCDSDSDTSSNTTSNCPGSGSAIHKITFHSNISNCDVTYSLFSNTIEKSATNCTYDSSNDFTDEPLTSSNVSVGKFDLYVSNTNHVTQPIILMVIQATAKVSNQSTEFDLQTLISQRRLNIQ